MLGSSKSPDELPWDPDNTSLPTRKNLPSIPGAPEGAAWVWGKDDYVSLPAIACNVLFRSVSFFFAGADSLIIYRLDG